MMARGGGSYTRYTTCVPHDRVSSNFALQKDPLLTFCLKKGSPFDQKKPYKRSFLAKN